MQALSPLISTDRLAAYQKGTGIDLTALDSALIAGFDLGTLYLAENPGNLPSIEGAFRERLIAEVTTRKPHPALTSLSGVVGRTPQSLLLYEEHLIAAAVGDPTLVKIVEAFARGKLKRSVPALQGAALSPLADFSANAPLRFLVPGPFEGRWMLGAEGLLAAADGVGVAAAPIGSQRVLLSVAIQGPWEATSELAAAERLRLAWEQLAHSSTGKLFGLDAPTSPPSIENSGTRVSLETELELRPIVAGLRAAVAADVWEMLGPIQGPDARSEETP
jgi:hypothetical protein